MADGSSSEFGNVVGPEQEEIVEQSQRVKALMLMDHYGLGKALMVKDPPTLTDEELRATEHLTPHAYALPLAVDDDTSRETSHLVLCNDSRMFVVERPDEPGEALKYDHYFVRNPGRVDHPDEIKPPERYFFASTRSDISSLINFIGFTDVKPKGFIKERNTSQFEAPAFERYIGQAMQHSFQLSGIREDRDRVAIQSNVQQAFVKNGPLRAAVADSPPHPQR